LEATPGASYDLPFILRHVHTAALCHHDREPDVVRQRRLVRLKVVLGVQAGGIRDDPPACLGAPHIKDLVMLPRHSPLANLLDERNRIVPTDFQSDVPTDVSFRGFTPKCHQYRASNVL
jgi:hypothetical protein